MSDLPSRLEEAMHLYSARLEHSQKHMGILLEAAQRLRELEDVLAPFVEAYERARQKDSWAAAYLNNSAWAKAHAALRSTRENSRDE